MDSDRAHRLRVLTEDPSRQTIRSVICTTHDLLQVLELRDGEHRTEDLIAPDRHVVRDSGDHRGFDVVTLEDGKGGRRGMNE